MKESKVEFSRHVTLLDATMVVAGSMIGSGIFIVSAEIARNVGGAGWLVAMWLLAGLVTVVAAISYGELSAMFPRAGGMYVYLREAFGPLVGFLYGWALFTIIQTGTIAAVGVAFAKFASYLFPPLADDVVLISIFGFNISAAQFLAIAIIILLTYINSRGIKNGVFVQTSLTIIKILSLFGLIAFGFMLGSDGDVWSRNWAGAWDFTKLTQEGSGITTLPVAGLAVLGSVTIAMKGTLFSCDSWHNISFIAGEVKNPQKNIGLSLILGTLIVTVIYLLANLMYLSLLPVAEIAFAKNDRVGVMAAERIFGSAGTIVIALMIMVSTFGCNNGLIMSGARVYYMMAKDRLFFARAGVLNSKQVPVFSLWTQCVWASALCLTGKYNELLAFVMFGVLVFYALTILGIYVLRRKRPELPRPYKAIGYPVLPALYILTAGGLALLLLIFETNFTLPGLAIILAGIPVYYMIVRRKDPALTLAND